MRAVTVMSGQYRFERWRPAGLQYAEARVSIEPGDQTSVTISPDALGWMREAFGAGVSTTLTPQERAEVEQGVREGLDAAGGRGRVTIEYLDISTTSTGPGDICDAVTRAVQRALGQEID